MAQNVYILRYSPLVKLVLSWPVVVGFSPTGKLACLFPSAMVQAGQRRVVFQLVIISGQLV